MALRAVEIEALLTVDDKDVARAERNIKKTGEDIERKPVTQKVKGDEKEALNAIGRVAAEGKKLVSERTVATVDANIERAEKGLDRAQARLDYLRSVETDLDVKADIARAEANLQKLERQREALVSARTKIEAIAETDKAESNLQRFLSHFKRDAEAAGTQGGRSLTSGLDAATRGAGNAVGAAVGGEIEDTLVSALAAIPVAGGIVLGAVAIGKAINSAIEQGLAVEVGYDRLQGLTGISPEQAGRIGRAAGEAYANVFGESIESNMNAARLGLQFRIIDPAASTRDAQAVIQGLQGISDVLEEDVQPVARAVTSMLSSGLAKSAQEAFDILAAGARNGVNLGEDLLDTFNEYSAVFASLGITGPEALGLMNQGLASGARNSDIMADALLELRNLTTAMSDDTRAAFKLMGLDADETAAKIAAGGPKAREGLDEIFDGLREIQDPLQKNTAGISIFGTKWEDTAGALGSLDLSTAVEQLDGVTGSAQRMFDTLADNDAGKLEQAQRNIDVAVQGIQGALAAAFSDPLSDAAEFVAQNRGPVLEFFSDLVNGAIDFGIAASESFGEFVSGPLADAAEGVIAFLKLSNFDPFKDWSDLEDVVAGMRGFDSTTSDATSTLEGMRGQFNGFMDDQVKVGYLSDASLRLAGAIDEVGAKSGDMESQVRGAIAALGDEIAAADAAGESQSDLAGRYEAGRRALEDQMVQAGMSRDAARKLIETIQETPASKSTEYSSNVRDEMGKVSDLAGRVTRLPDGSFYIQGKTDDAYSRLMSLQAAIRQVTGNHGFKLAMGPGGQGGITQHDGGVVVPMASGGVLGRGLTPMAPIAQAVPPNTWRVVGDRMKDREFFIPDDGSERSLSILLEAMRSFGVLPMSDGGVVGSGSGGSAQFFDQSTYIAYDVEKLQRDKEQKMRKLLGDAGLTDT
ncbi:phage tail tape measure protein [Microbacterium oleivorans]|uniref:Phage tail tape measure protein n=1 Tax=Microbacterium oleivorans TaxID=273677 RepID=A0A4V3B3B2_9MICO|nr:phage tail tape measure protein [Microbacterium oleivorans]TDL43830.1 phage tail tape measure protein [Microbacterium oleivorans]